VAEKIVRYGDRVEVPYDGKHWSILHKLRRRALEIVEALSSAAVPSTVHGSIARGDVDARSDVDVVIPIVIPSHKVELTLTQGGFKVYTRRIAQATPGHTPKGHIYLDVDEIRSVTFPLIGFRSLELEFYRFGGMLSLEALREGCRVPGCTKRLTLIEPTPKGHIESPVYGREGEVAQVVGVSLNIVRERVRVLTRRDAAGRTGLFINTSVGEDETFETALKKLLDRNPILRRRYAER